MNFLTFGDFAQINKPVPNYSRGTVVQIASVSLIKGRVNYTAVVMFGGDKPTEVIGPYPAQAFIFLRSPTDNHLALLIQHLTQTQGQEQVIRAERISRKHAPHCKCSDCRPEPANYGQDHHSRPTRDNY